MKITGSSKMFCLGSSSCFIMAILAAANSSQSPDLVHTSIGLSLHTGQQLQVLDLKILGQFSGEVLIWMNLLQSGPFGE